MPSNDSSSDLLILIILALLGFILYVWAIIALLVHIKVMPVWAIVISVLLLIFLPALGTVVTLFLAYFARDYSVREVAY